MKVIFNGQVPKDINYPESMEDAVAFSINNDRIAISDGASESFDSKSWAQLIVQNYVVDPSINHSWLVNLANHFKLKFDLTSLSWSKAAAFERGSFATLLGIEYFKDLKHVEVISVGDCFAVLLDGSNVVKTFPYHSHDQFQQRPNLFCSNIAENKFFQDSHFYNDNQITWNLENLSSPKILCMTDALGEWALRTAAEDKPQWEFLLGISDTEVLKNFVMSERAVKNMKIDDVTLVSISFDSDDENELSLT